MKGSAKRRGGCGEIEGGPCAVGGAMRIRVSSDVGKMLGRGMIWLGGGGSTALIRDLLEPGRSDEDGAHGSDV